MISEWFFELESSDTRHSAALALALIAALLHAILGAMQKGRIDPWTARSFIDLSYCFIAAPFALYFLPYPELEVIPILVTALFIHSIYKLLIAMAYTRADYTVVYPIVRGTGPLITVLAAGLVFGEVYSSLQWMGVLTLVLGIFGLAVYNIVKISVARQQLMLAIALALITGITVAGYTTVDAIGVRAVPNPFIFIAWLFFLDGMMMPIIWYFKFRHRFRPSDYPYLLSRGFIGGIIAIGSFGAIMIATRIDQVGEAAVLRETSTVFAAVIGWIFLNETVGIRRLILIFLIASGAVIVEFG